MQLDSKECLIKCIAQQLSLDSFGKALWASWREELRGTAEPGDWLARQRKELQTI